VDLQAGDSTRFQADIDDGVRGIKTIQDLKDKSLDNIVYLIELVDSQEVNSSNEG
jgi:hypothetical protein